MSVLDELNGKEPSNQLTSIKDFIDSETTEYGSIVDSVKDRIINNKKFRLFGEKIIVEVYKKDGTKDQDLTDKLERIQDFNNMTELLMANERVLSLEGKSYIRATKYQDQVLLTIANSGIHRSINNNNKLLQEATIYLNIASGNSNFLVVEEYKDKQVKRIFKQLQLEKGKLIKTDLEAKDFTKETNIKTEKETDLDTKIPVVVFQNKATLHGEGEADFGAKTEPYERALQIAWNRMLRDDIMISPLLAYNGKVSDTGSSDLRLKVLSQKGMLQNNSDNVEDEEGSINDKIKYISPDTMIQEANFKNFLKKEDKLFEQCGQRRSVEPDNGAQQTSYQVSQARDNEIITINYLVNQRKKDLEQLFKKIMQVDGCYDEDLRINVKITPNYTLDDNARVDYWVKRISGGFGTQEQAMADLDHISIEEAKETIEAIKEEKQEQMDKQIELANASNPEQDDTNTDEDNLNNKSASVSKPDERTPKNETDTSKVDKGESNGN